MEVVGFSFTCFRYGLLGAGALAMRRSIRTGVLVSVLLSGLAAYFAGNAIAAPGQTDPGEVSTGPSEQLAQPAEAPAALERPDCVLQEGVCRSECAHHADEKRCIVRRCEPLFLQCMASLPVGKVVPLPVACMTADQEAVRRLERQGELLDADPTLFADSFNNLVRARIICRAGYSSKALSIYDEIQESMAVKRVLDNRARQ